MRFGSWLLQRGPGSLERQSPNNSGRGDSKDGFVVLIVYHEVSVPYYVQDEPTRDLQLD